MKLLTTDQVKDLAKNNGYEYAALKAIIEVESGGKGFAEDGKIIIQFESLWFQRKTAKEYAEYARIKKVIEAGKPKTAIDFTFYQNYKSVIENKVSGQATEWTAFNLAYTINPDAAMESTSIGMMQVMGFHYKLLGFSTVGEMWDYAKESEANQVDIAIRFIKSNQKLDAGLKSKNWNTVAYYYNGEQYKKFNYDSRLLTAYTKYI